MHIYMSLIAIFLGVIYFTFFINRFVRKILNIHTNTLFIIIVGMIMILLALPARNILSLYSVIYYHFLVIMLLLELLNIVMKRYLIYRFIFTTGILGLAITVIFLGYGYYNIHNVIVTSYDLSSNEINDFKIIEIADLHMSTSLNVVSLQKYCDEMSALNADIVVLVGDIFDENTSFKDMVDSSKILSTIKNKQGIYYVYGNHDNGLTNFNNVSFGPQEIRENLEENGIKVLEDNVVSLDKVNIIGRKDANFFGTNQRLSTNELLSLIPDSKKENYTILLDHQPLELEENASLGIDLQLSGHTHGGQLFPMGIVQSLTTNTLVKGKRTIGNFTAITSSGISGWRYPIKTGAPSEYVVINID